MKKTDPPIIIEQIFNVSMKRVWDAITQHDEMIQWFFGNIPSFNPEVGFEIKFNVTSEDRNFMHMWKLIEVIPDKKIAYNWKYAEYPGDSNVVFELNEENGNACSLKVTTEVLENFPDDIPEFTRESCTAGWDYFICQRLKAYLEKNSKQS